MGVYVRGVFVLIPKSAVVKPLLNKPTLDPHILKNYRPVSNLPFISKVIAPTRLTHQSSYAIRL